LLLLSYAAQMANNADSGPNLLIRGVAFVFVLTGLLLIATGYRIRRGTSRMHFSPATAIYGVGAFTVAGVAAIAFGAFLLGAGS
jgi:hypothetical protein